MLVAFSPIFVADTKIIFRYDFVAPLIIENHYVIKYQFSLYEQLIQIAVNWNDSKKLIELELSLSVT